MFVCDVPLSLIRRDIIEALAGKALEMIFLDLQKGDEFEESPWYEASFCIHEPLPPNCIVGHYHPVVKSDPFVRWQ